jgi:phosphoglycerate kinase
MKFNTLEDMDLAGNRVLIRVDVNAPMTDGRVTDDTRLRALKPTIDYVLAAGGKPILLAHFLRPKGRMVPEMSLTVIVSALAKALDLPVEFEAETIGKGPKAAIAALAPGHVLLLENTRFYPGEEANDRGFAADLAALGDVYINDAFSVSHRAHASTDGVAKLLPAAAGRLMQAELEALSAALDKPQRPVIAVVGGAKVSTKLALLGNLSTRVDQIIIGGGMANTFLFAQGHAVGTSLCEKNMAATAREVLAQASANGCEIVLPQDVVIAREFRARAKSEVVPSDACPPDAMILDAGPLTVADIEARFETAKTVVWNGPLGAFELPPFNKATDAAAAKAASLTEAGRLLTVAGGGDTVAALNGSGAAAKFSYVSTAGGAFLEWMEGKTLPGVAALSA